MHRTLFQTTALLSAAVLTTACAASSPAARQAQSGAVCQAGRPVLVVRNDSGMTLQIVESRIGSGGRQVVAEVGAGRTEVNIRNDYSYGYSAEPSGGGQFLAGTTSRARVPDRAVSMERQCRPS